MASALPLSVIWKSPATACTNALQSDLFTFPARLACRDDLLGIGRRGRRGGDVCHVSSRDRGLGRCTLRRRRPSSTLRALRLLRRALLALGRRRLEHLLHLRLADFGRGRRVGRVLRPPLLSPSGSSSPPGSDARASYTSRPARSTATEEAMAVARVTLRLHGRSCDLEGGRAERTASSTLRRKKIHFWVDAGNESAVAQSRRTAEPIA